MVRLYGPMFSLGASGTIGESITFANWKGRYYARERVIPSNPKSGGQVGMRSMMKFLAQIWKDGVSAGNKATWEDRAKQLNASAFNAFVSYNMLRWRQFRSPSIVMSPSEDDTPDTFDTDSATPGERLVTYAWTNSAATDGWGALIYRSLSTGFTPNWDTCIAAVLCIGADDYTYIDSPLAAGIYYYRSQSFTHQGVKGVLTAEADATVV